MPALLERVRQGHAPSVARMISAVEGMHRGVEDVLPDLYAAGGRAHVVGVTGPPGAGKSTLVDKLAGELRVRQFSVGIIAVDPSSSLTGGAILGDRVRMTSAARDPQIFVRSMANRGHVGGISRATIDAVAVLDASGTQWVIIETVGVGQAEVEIMQIAHTTVVVSVPGLGDDVQALKAGLLEIADIHVVNKADRPDANRTRRELVSSLELGGMPANGWPVPVLDAVALNAVGIPELVDAIVEHAAWLRRSGQLELRELSAARTRIREIIEDLARRAVIDPADDVALEQLVREVAGRRIDPWTAAKLLAKGIAPVTFIQATTT